MPAVDAMVHEGVDIDMAPSMPGMEPRKGAGQGAAVSEPARQSYQAANEPETVRYAPPQDEYEAEPVTQANTSPDADDYDDYRPTAYAPNDDVIEDAAPEPVQAEPVEEARAAFAGGSAAAPKRRAWSVSGPSIGGPAAEGQAESAPIESVKARLRRRARRTAEAGKAGRKATITFRMPARDLIRLRFSSRELGVSCQTIILEAIECYLEANDISPLSDEDFAAETSRLIRLKKEKARRRSG